MVQPSLDDSLSNNVLTHIALHQYNGAYDSSERAGAKAFPQIAESGKRFWQTEVSGSGPHLPAGTGIENALYYARMVHFDMTLAETNAFLYWWLWSNNASGDFPGSLIGVKGSSVQAALRLYAIGQYSRFIRPGWQRLSASDSPAARVYSSAYRSPDTNEIAIVLINNSNIAVQTDANLLDAEFVSLEAWRTSEEEKLAELGTQQVSGNRADLKLPPKSVTTFYGYVRALAD
jgi:O-glycosyl hydrolase